MVPPLSMLEELLNTETIENSYHPVKDYLLPLAWDGVPRIDHALKTYLGAIMPEPYLSEVSRKMFIGAVKRIFEPGSTFQYMVVLEGDQGIGKSTAVSILASKRWFLDALPHLQDKDAALYLIGTWLCEIGELTAIMKTDAGHAKAFISRDTDRIRPPYGSRRVEYPRSTLFIGTTNLRDYLTDPTGNRRYWPVRCTCVDFDALERDRDQLWAEAVSEYQFGHERLFLDGVALKQAERIQELARAEDEVDLMVDEFRIWEAETMKDEGRLPDNLSMNELFKSVWTNFKPDKGSMMRAAHAMRQLGYDKVKKHGINFWRKK
jgi:predicted P-loop ATPase